MRENGFDELQRPIRNLQGETVAVLDGGIPAMLLTWVEGEPIKPENGSQYAEDLGVLACKIHKAAKGFTGVRIHYDAALSDRMIDEIRIAVNAGHISEENGEICVRELILIFNKTL